MPDDERKVLVAESPVNHLFFTTIGSLGEAKIVCRTGLEGETFRMTCGTGIFGSLSAYYGQPSGSCGCPGVQLPNGGQCASKMPDVVKPYSLCDVKTKDDGLGMYHEEQSLLDVVANEVYLPDEIVPSLDYMYIPCFYGFTGYGEECCAMSVDNRKRPEFGPLIPADVSDCRSNTAQEIVDGACLGTGNCTISVNYNTTYKWNPKAGKTECKAEGCNVRKDFGRTVARAKLSGSGNFSKCPEPIDRYVPHHSTLPLPADSPSLTPPRYMTVVGKCFDDTFTFGGIDYDKAKIVKAFAYIDAFMMLILMYSVKWLQDREVEEVEIADIGTCTAADYTLKLETVPYSEDMVELAQTLKDHLEHVLNDQTICKAAEDPEQNSCR